MFKFFKKLTKKIILKYLYLEKMPFYEIDFKYLTRYYNIELEFLEKLTTALETEFKNEKFLRLLNTPSYKTIIDDYQNTINKVKEKIKQRKEKERKAVLTYLYFYRLGFLEKNKIAAEFVPLYRQYVRTYETKFKNYHYETAYKNYVIEHRKEIMEKDFE